MQVDVYNGPSDPVSVWPKPEPGKEGALLCFDPSRLFLQSPFQCQSLPVGVKNAYTKVIFQKQNRAESMSLLGRP